MNAALPSTPAGALAPALANGALLFDLETTGVNVHEDRIVTAFLGLWVTSEQQFIQQAEFLADPGVDIPAGAAAVHGVTTERARAEGEPVREVIAHLAHVISLECDTRHPGARPLVAYNAAYDISLLHAECLRHGVTPPEWARIHVLDPLVIDRKLYRFRKGKGARKLGTLALAYGIEVDETRTHAADYDCYLAARILDRQLQDARLARTPFATLHANQKAWAAQQAADLQHYFRTKGGKPHEVVNGDWPLRQPPAYTQTTAPTTPTPSATPSATPSTQTESEPAA